MSIALLTCIAFLVVLPDVLFGTRVLDSRPRVGLLVWFACGVIGWSAAIDASLRLALGPLHSNLFTALQLFFVNLGDGHPLRGYGLREVIGLSITFDLVALLFGGWAIAAWETAHLRRDHRTLLDLLATRVDGSAPLYVLDYEHPVAYFVPGDGGRIVLSTGTSSCFDESELSAVIAHEHGHGAGRHGALLVPMRALNPFIAFVPFARYASTSIRSYVEMAADDYARRSVPDQHLQAALVKSDVLLSAPTCALGMSSMTVHRRIVRLARPTTPLLDTCLSATVLGIMVSTSWSLLALH